MSSNSVYYGTLVHSVSRTNLEIIQNGVLAVNSNGVIVHLGKNVTNFDAWLSTSPYRNYRVCIDEGVMRAVKTNFYNYYQRTGLQVGS